MYTIRADSTTYTEPRVTLTGSIEQRDGYAPDRAVDLSLLVCDRCGAVVIAGDISLSSDDVHDRWHAALDAPPGATQAASPDGQW